MASKPSPPFHSGDKPKYRILRGYALDPGFSTQLHTARINEVIYKVKWEDDLAPGPIGEYLEVIDVDPASNCFYEPIDLDAKYVLGQNGLSPSEGNPQFHQQMVYAVIMKTISHFEFALGRKLIWRGRNNKESWEIEDLRTRLNFQFVRRLRIYPHGLRDSNAYYDPDKVALLFGYFTAANEIQGSNYPGGVVFTCLSPDIVAHEATHAILDSIHNRFIEDTHPDVGAFHEGFSDIIALLQRFTFVELVEHQLTSTRGRLDKYNVLGELATQFGLALEEERGALRGAIGRVQNGRWTKLVPNPNDYQERLEPHERGAILVATIFDAFQRIYQFKTQDLIRIATNGTGILPKGNISPDLVKRLAAEACKIASHFLHICIRALDYCPPFDITFGNYLQALITADLDAAPEDEIGYRIALIEAFRARGIFPDRVNTLSVESLRWARPDLTESDKKLFKETADFLEPKLRLLMKETDRKEIYILSHEIQRSLYWFIMDKIQKKDNDEWDTLLQLLGLTAKPFVLLYQGKSYEIPVPDLEVHQVRAVYRAGREGDLISQVIIVLSQTVRLTVPKENPEPEEEPHEVIKYRGGCTLILSLGNLNHIEYVISKNIRSQFRFDQQVNYQQHGEDFSMGLTTYADDTGDNYDLSFKQLHFHSR